MANHSAWVDGCDRYSSSLSALALCCVAPHTPTFEPAKRDVFVTPAGRGATDHLPFNFGAAELMAPARYGPLTTMGAAPDTKPRVWSKSPAVGTLLSA